MFDKTWHWISLCWVSLLSYPGWSQPVKNIGVDLEGFSTNYYHIPFIDLDKETRMQVVVDKEPGQYLGHPTTHLLEDGKTILCVYPKGHGKGTIVYKRSPDGGKTWSDRLPVPPSWQTSLEVPTLFPTVDASGQQRLNLFSGLYPARMATSVDNGEIWSELKALGDWGGIVVMGDLLALNTGAGHYLAMFHDDGRFFSKDGRSPDEELQSTNNQAKFTLYKTLSFDGGVTWTYPQAVFTSQMAHLCEPGLVRSPDGKQIAALLRENSRRLNSHIILSNDEGKNWSSPRELPNALTGDRHQCLYLPDGRLLISFRDATPGLTRFQHLQSTCKNCNVQQLKQKAGPVSPTAGDWVAWVGTYEDLVEGREGACRIRLKDNTKGSDCAYPALELLPDSTIVATTYGAWDEGEFPYILSLRFTIGDIDRRLP